MKCRKPRIIWTEVIAMAGFGRFKLTDALPDQPAGDEDLNTGGGLPGTSPGGKGKGKGKKKGKMTRDQSKLSQSGSADADPGIRDRMVDSGRANQQTGRQRTTGK
jgi:hypothetical protein